MADLAALVSPGQFKAKKKEPERMLADFTFYVLRKQLSPTLHIQQVLLQRKKCRGPREMTLKTNDLLYIKLIHDKKSSKKVVPTPSQ